MNQMINDEIKIIWIWEIVRKETGYFEVETGSDTNRFVGIEFYDRWR